MVALEIKNDLHALYFAANVYNTSKEILNLYNRNLYANLNYYLKIHLVYWK